MVRIGPKFLFVTGIFTAGAASILFGLLDRSAPGATFLALSVVCRCFEATGVSAFITSGLAIVINEFPEHVATVFGVTQSGVCIGLLIGPAVGGVLNEAGGFGLPFYVIGALIFLTGLVTCICLPPPQGVAQKKGTSMVLLLCSPLVLVGLQFVLVMYAGISFLQPILSTYLEQFHLSPSMVGLVFIIVPVLQGLSTLWGYLADKKNMTQMQFISGSIVSSVGYLVIGPTPVLPFLPVKLWVIILGLVIFGLGVGFAFVAPVKCIIQGAGELGFEYNLSVFGMVSGLFCATINIGAFIGPAVAGLLAQSIGFRWATTAMSGIFILSTFCTICFFSIRYIKIRREEKVLQEHHETKEMYSLDLRECTISLMPLVQKQ